MCLSNVSFSRTASKKTQEKQNYLKWKGAGEDSGIACLRHRETLGDEYEMLNEMRLSKTLARIYSFGDKTIN
jgi:hypothetical protein